MQDEYIITLVKASVAPTVLPEDINKISVLTERLVLAEGTDGEEELIRFIISCDGTVLGITKFHDENNIVMTLTLMSILSTAILNIQDTLPEGVKELHFAEAMQSVVERHKEQYTDFQNTLREYIAKGVPAVNLYQVYVVAQLEASLTLWEGFLRENNDI